MPAMIEPDALTEAAAREAFRKAVKELRQSLLDCSRKGGSA